MPQLNGGGGDDLGANDEMISFKDEGEQEEKLSENVSAERDLDDVKSSLVNESENNSSSSDSEQTERRPQPRAEPESYEKARDYFTEALRRQQDVGFLKSPHYPAYPFLVIPELASPYISNGALSQGARPYLQMKWPLLDVPGPAVLKGPRSPTHPSHKVPLVQHALMHPLTPLITYSNEPFPPATPPPHLSPDILDPKTGLPRVSHPVELQPCYPQIPPPLGWLVPQQGQHMYPLHTPGFRHPYPTLAVSASMSSLVASRFPAHMSCPTPGLQTAPPLAPPPALISPSVKQEPRGDTSPHATSPGSRQEAQRVHIKKPLNAFMLYMKETRAQVVSECTLRESAAINQILGRRWHSLSREEQAKYYDLARQERQLHMQLYPGWTARDNYGKRKKRKRESRAEAPEDFSVRSKKICVQYLPQEKMIDSPLSSQGSMLDSPATPSATLASPAAPASTHSEHAQPLSLTTKHPLPHHSTRLTKTSSSSSSSSSFSPASSLSSPPSSLSPTSSHPSISLPIGSPGSQSTPPIISRPVPFSSLHHALLSPPSPFHQAALHSHHALLQTQPLSLVTKSAD